MQHICLLQNKWNSVKHHRPLTRVQMEACRVTLVSSCRQLSYTLLSRQNFWICGSRCTELARMLKLVCGRLTVSL